MYTSKFWSIKNYTVCVIAFKEKLLTRTFITNYLDLFMISEHRYLLAIIESTIQCPSSNEWMTKLWMGGQHQTFDKLTHTREKIYQIFGSDIGRCTAKLNKQKRKSWKTTNFLTHDSKERKERERKAGEKRKIGRTDRHGMISSYQIAIKRHPINIKHVQSKGEMKHEKYKKERGIERFPFKFFYLSWRPTTKDVIEFLTMNRRWVIYAVHNIRGRFSYICDRNSSNNSL